jgi:hypothetical protein
VLPPAVAVDGCVVERWIGAAVVGAVRVDGGAEKVRVPRLPKLPPRPTRASASVTRNASAVNSANAMAQGR